MLSAEWAFRAVKQLEYLPVKADILQPPLSLKAGALVGPYEIVAPLGAGGMGEVYRARDDRLSREVALKVLSSDLAAGEPLRRFEQEARAASALNHPNIITIHDIGRAGATAYIAMELIEGTDLRSVMGTEPMSLKQALRIAVKVADGLAAAHERGIIHRDLKPENVMISRDGFVKLLDFGLAKLVRPVSDTECTLPHTVAGAVFGTIAYMSPEQAAGRPVDIRSDQFSFGTILYEMLAGRLPFAADTVPETMAAIIRDEPKPISKFTDGVPPQVERILMRCLAKDPDQRYAATRDLARDLREIRDLSSVPATSGHRSARAVLKHVPPPSRWITAAAVVLATAAGGVLLWQRHIAPLESGKRVVAVIPFRDLSGTADGQMFSDGISEMISARLAENRGVHVVTPQPSGDPVSAARRAGANLLLSGSVQHVGELLRVSFTISDASSRTQVDGDSVTGAASDIFTFEDMVADRILDTLNVVGVPARAKPPVRIASAQAQRLYIEALGLMFRFKDEKSIDAAIKRLEKVLLDSRDAPQVNAAMGRAYYLKYTKQKTPALLEQASLYAERAVRQDPLLADAHVTLGNVRLASGNLSGAEREFQQALGLRSDIAPAVLGMAETMAKQGRGSEAKSLYDRAVTLDPNWQDVFAKYGRFSMDHGDYPHAIELFQKMIDVIPDSPRGYTNLGAAYHKVGKYDQALAAYNMAMERGPTPILFSNMGTCHYALGRYADAAVSYQKAVALAPDHYMWWINLGDALRWTPGQSAQAVAAYTHGIDRARETAAGNSADALVRAVMAAALAKSGQLASAKEEIDGALKIDPTNPDVLYAAAVIALLRGQSDSALSWLERAVSAGYPVSDVRRDPELTTLRKLPGFEKAVANAAR